MNKSTKVLVIQFLFFATIFLIIRYFIVQSGYFTGLLIPIISGIITILLAPQFKVIKVEGKDKVVMRWIFSKTGKPIDWL